MIILKRNLRPLGLSEFERFFLFNSPYLFRPVREFAVKSTFDHRSFATSKTKAALAKDSEQHSFAVEESAADNLGSFASESTSYRYQQRVGQRHVSFTKYSRSVNSAAVRVLKNAAVHATNKKGQLWMTNDYTDLYIGLWHNPNLPGKKNHRKHKTMKP